MPAPGAPAAVTAAVSAADDSAAAAATAGSGVVAAAALGAGSGTPDTQGPAGCCSMGHAQRMRWHGLPSRSPKALEQSEFGTPEQSTETPVQMAHLPTRRAPALTAQPPTHSWKGSSVHPAEERPSPIRARMAPEQREQPPGWTSHPPTAHSWLRRLTWQGRQLAEHCPWLRCPTRSPGAASPTRRRPLRQAPRRAQARGRVQLLV
mmetsp:Transcript_15565/g.46972  ORF Transcript_15565/g.46972 Transcript_15565/m.46972 type:complete len:206 (-) Transcript_15565:2671-3288(-)